MEKKEVYGQELKKLKKIFEDVEENKAKLVDGLIEDAAFLKAENYMLKKSIDELGMVQYNPNNKSQQRTTESAKQYLKNVNSYSVVIKTLNGVLMRNEIEGEDEFDQFIKSRQIEVIE